MVSAQRSIILTPAAEKIISTMFTKAFLVCAFATAALAIHYPEGIHPAICPNYPYCDLEVLARHTPQGIPIPDWELPHARMVAAPVPAVEAIEPVTENVIGAGAMFPADFDSSLCPNYPYCDLDVLAHHTPQGIPIPDRELPHARMVAAPVAAVEAVEPVAENIIGAGAKFPADFDSSLCPNYPYCF